MERQEIPASVGRAKPKTPGNAREAGPQASELIPQAHHDAAEEEVVRSAACGALVGKRGRIDARFWNPVVAMVEGVVQLDAIRQRMTFPRHPKNFVEGQIGVVERDRPKNIPAGVSDGAGGRDLAEIRGGAIAVDVVDADAGKAHAGQNVGADSRTDQAVDPGENVARIDSGQRRERSSGLRGNKSANLPPAHDVSQKALLIMPKRHFVNAVDGKALRPVVGGAAAILAPVE